MRRLLYGLEALVTVHFAKEEEIYVPVLEAAMTAEQAEAMFAAMGHAAHDRSHRGTVTRGAVLRSRPSSHACRQE